jgi:hypothetical protein
MRKKVKRAEFEFGWLKNGRRGPDREIFAKSQRLSTGVTGDRLRQHAKLPQKMLVKRVMEENQAHNT